MESLYFREMDSPMGTITLMGTGDGLRELVFGRFTTKRDKNKHLVLAEKQLEAYFKKELRKFSIPLDLIGTDFQKEVWKALESVPYGATSSYLDIARSIGNAEAVRAVGAANGKNPVPIILPCHRVIGKHGSIYM